MSETAAADQPGADDARDGDATDAGDAGDDDGLRDRLGILFVILLVAFGLRFYDLGRNPPELFEDELSGLVSIESIATTGHDIERTVLPFLTTRLELKQPLYFVATLPFQAVLGQTTMAARLPAVLFGLAGVLLILAVAVVLGAGTIVGLIAAGLYVITPWAIHYARAGWEPAAFLPFTLGGIALLWAGLRDHRRRMVVAAAAVLAVGAYAYHPALLMHVVLAGVIVLVRFRSLGRPDVIDLTIGGVVAAIILVPYALGATDPLFLQRTRGISVFRNGVNLDALILAWHNYWAQWDPSFLLGGRATNPRINPGPLILAWTVPFIALGLDAIVHRRSAVDRFLIVWLLVGPLPAALTEDGTTPHAARGLAVLPAILIVTAIGIARAWAMAEGSARRWLRPVVFAAVAAVAFGASTAWAVDYFDDYPVRSASWWGYGAGAAFGMIDSEVPSGATVCIATNDISGFTFWHQVSYYLPDPQFRILKGLADPACSVPGTYVLALVSRDLEQPVQQVDTVADINGKPFYELDVVVAGG